MAEYTIHQVRQGWEARNGVTSVTVENPVRHHGIIRGVMTVTQGEVIRYRDRTNLTSARIRTSVLKTLNEAGIEIDAGTLIALEDACRTRRTETDNETDDRGTDISEKVPHTLEELQAVFDRHLLIKDGALIPVLAGALLAHRLSSESVWLLIVAPPGGTKTEPLRSLYDYPGIFPLSELTARTFASGLDTQGPDPSLLNRLEDEILVLKDLTTVLEMHRDERQAIFAQLREIYDGRYDKVWGTGKELHWEGRLGFVAGVTPVIDRHHSALAVLGERFVMLRIAMPDRGQLARVAVRGSGKESTMRSDLQGAMHGFLAHRSGEAPSTSEEVLDRLAGVADFVTRARSGVVRDGYRRELEYAPEPEAPTRFVKVLRSLACGIALAHDRDEVTDMDLGYVLRVAVDSLPEVRRRVIETLVKRTLTTDTEGNPSTSAIAGETQFSTTSIRRALEDLQALGVVDVEKGGQGKADLWHLKDDLTSVFESLQEAIKTTFPDMSEPRSPVCNKCGGPAGDKSGLCLDPECDGEDPEVEPF